MTDKELDAALRLPPIRPEAANCPHGWYQGKGCTVCPLPADLAPDWRDDYEQRTGVRP